MKKLLLKMLCCLSLLTGLATAQRLSTFEPVDAHGLDQVDLITLIPSWRFPGLGKTQGALPGSWDISVPGGCATVTNSVPQTWWTCRTGWWFGGIGPGYTSNFTFDNQPMFGQTANSIQTNYMVGTTHCIKWDIYGVFDGNGTGHPYSGNPAATLNYPSTGCNGTTQTATLTTIDNTGLTTSYSSTTGSLKITATYNTSGNNAGSDVFGNTEGFNSNGTVFTDTLGASTTLGNNGSNQQDSADPTQYQYTDSNGATQDINLTVGSAQSFIPRGSSSCVNYPSTPFTVHPVTNITYPDNTSFGIAWDTNGTGISGLIGTVTLRTGGTIAYSYGTPLSGCGPLAFASLTRTTVDGATTYSTSISGNNQTTYVYDAGKNKTKYYFYIGAGSPFIIEIDKWQNTGTVASPVYTEISTAQYCYQSTCTITPSYPITQVRVENFIWNTSGTAVEINQDIKTFDSTYGLLLTDANTDEITSGTPTITKTIVYGTYSSGTCSAITNTKINDHPCTVTTTKGSTWLSENTYTYNANGALTSSSACLSSTCTGSSALTTSYSPNTTGTYASITAPNSQVTNYTYGDCNSLLPTDVTTTVNSVAIDNKTTWNCNSATIVDTTDANSNEDDTAYDSMNRIHTHYDRLGDSNTTTYAYGTPTFDHVKVTDPMGVSRYTYNDGLGRSTISQTCQTSACTSADTVSKTYSWKDSGNNALTNFLTTTSVPCSKALGTPCSTSASYATELLTNPMIGPNNSLDVNGGTGNWTYDANDVSFVVGPAPTNENTKTVQTERNGFGQVTSVCALETSGGSSCGQLMGNSGILTSTSYSYATGSSTVTTTRGSQTHTTISDALGRVTSVQTPEAGTFASAYDNVPANYCVSGGTAYAESGFLATTNDAAGNHVCFYRDGLGRPVGIGNNNQSATNPCKRFAYDSTANGLVSAPSGYPSTGTNIIGRVVEAETDNCNTPVSPLTDEWFAYDNNGRMTDMWEKTPNSGSTYYHTTVTYDADGVVTSISGIPGYANSFTFTTDGEDRPNASKYGTTTVVSATAGNAFQYDNASRPLNVPWGTAGDQDTYTYDGLEHMTEYTFSVNSTTDDGKLTWNKAGSLQQLQITDGFNSGGSQTCKYLYDDVSRLGVPPNSPTPPNSMGTKSVDCGTNYNGEYGWDQYNNLTQAGTNSWAPGYSPTNNEMTGSSYDSDGNVKYDGVSSYTWDLYGKMISVRTGSTASVCGTSGICVTYDASGRAVEINNAGTTSQILYGPTGRLGTMNGQTPLGMLIKQPGGGVFGTTGPTGTGTKTVLHTDWLGTARLGTLLTGRTVSFDTAYAPFSQTYNSFQNNPVPYFTGDPSDITGNANLSPAQLFDTPNRELMSNAGRWLSPEFSGSFNGYAYVTDPNTQTDPSGLIPFDVQQTFFPTNLMFPFFLVGTHVEESSTLSKTGYNVPDCDYPPGYVPGSSWRDLNSSLFLFMKPKDEGYLSEREIKLLQRLRSGYTNQLSEALDDNGNILYRDKEELENATYRAMEFMEQGADDPVNHTIWETEQIRANPLAADSIRASMSEMAMSQGARMDFDNIIEGGGKMNSILLGAHMYEELRDPNNLNHKEAMWLLRALGDTTYSPPQLTCNGSGCSSTW